MKKIILIFSLSLLFQYGASAQVNGEIEQNNTKAHMSTSGLIFYDYANQLPGYSVPKNDNLSTIFSSAFWFGGLDQGGGLHLCAQRVATMGQDIFTGPIANNYSSIVYQTAYNKIWHITKSEIDNHILNYGNAGYTMPTSISSWPGNGDVLNGEAAQMAAYVDINENNVYDPANGDYPNIRGDKASFFILNDAAESHVSSGGQALDMEFHFMIYQYQTSGYLDNSTFVNIRIFNRSEHTYSKFRVAYSLNPDVGGALDDFVGSAPTKDMIFAYNSDNDDQSAFSPGYGVNPPAMGAKMLNHQMDAAGYFNDINTSPLIDPVLATEFWGFMNASWGNTGIHFTSGGTGYGGAVHANYLFPDNPNVSGGWSENVLGNVGGERRMFMSSNDYLSFAPGESICYDYAILYARNGTNLETVDVLYSIADSVQQFFDAQTEFTCQTIILGQDEAIKRKEFSLYPNPANNQFSIGLSGEFDVVLYSIAGKKVLDKKGVDASNVLNIDLNDGVYIVRIKQEGLTYFKKMIVKNN